MSRTALIALTSFALTSCVMEAGNGRIVTLQRTVGPYTKVSVGSGIQASITVGDRSLQLTTDENLQAFVSTRVEGDTLVLRTISNSALKPTGPIFAQVTNDAIEGLDVSGGSQVSADATNAPNWTIDASGGSTVSVSRLNSPDLRVTGSGASHVDAFGIAISVNVTGSGGSQLNIDGVSAQNVTVDASGGSTLQVNASTAASGSASGGSSVTVSGNPGSRTIDTSGGSTVTYVNE